MHRRPIKRALSPTDPQSDAKRQQIESEEARARQREREEEDRWWWKNERKNEIDNADRLLIDRTTTDDRLLVPRLAVTPRNAMRRLDHLRITGSQLDARAFRSEAQPVYDKLYNYRGWDFNKRVYRCANCGKLSTPGQLQDWFNPGYTHADLTATMPMHDFDLRVVAYEGRFVSRSLAPRERAVHIKGNDLFKKRTHGLLLAPLSEKPVVFVCSERCAEEQARFNYIWDDKNQRLRAMEADVSSEFRRGSPQWFESYWKRAPEARISLYDRHNHRNNHYLFFGDTI